MQAISDNLIHFIARATKDEPDKQFEIFKMIVENGLRFSPLDTRFDGGGIVFNKGICFTDIPLNFLDQHTAVYGKFGIGFKKSFVKNAGGNPARYFVDHMPTAERITKPDDKQGTRSFESRGLLFSNLVNLHKLIMTLKRKIDNPNEIGKDGLYNVAAKQIITTEQLENIYQQLIQIFSFDKPIGDLGSPRDDTDQIDIFYNEREWRIIPYKISINSGLIVQRDNEAYLPFRGNDIRVIIVPNNGIRKQVVKHFNELGNSDDVRLRSFADSLPPVFNYDDITFF
jgi:hypothetical protein